MAQQQPTERDAVCPTHGPFIETLLSTPNPRYVGVWSKCPACAREEQAARAEWEAAAKAAAAAEEAEALLRYRFACSGLEGRYTRAAFGNFDAPTPDKRHALAACVAFAEHIGSTAPGGDLWLIGPPGTGKTHLASAVVNHLIRRRDMDAGIFAVHEITRLARERIGTKRTDSMGYSGYRERPTRDNETPDELTDRLAGLPLLVVDEIGLSRGSAWEQEQIFSILNARYKNERSTVLCSNLTPDQLKTELKAALFDRMRERAEIVVMNWPSHRGTV